MATIEQTVKDWNKARKANRDKWIFFEGYIDGAPIRIKSYNLWIQRAEFRDFIDGYNGGTVKGANDFLTDFLGG